MEVDVPSNGSSAESTLWTDDVNTTRFFHEKVVEAQERQKLRLGENVEFYVVNLLCEFVSPRASGLGGDEGDCLALILKRALESPHGEQVLLFKRLGDTALYFSGFFQESFSTKCFDVRYYMTMGESAYGQLSSLMRGRNSYESTMGEIYRDMSRSFGKAVDVLMDVSEHTAGAATAAQERSSLSLYDAWLSTASEKLERDLLRRGIYPIKVPLKSTN
jgi:hypothetical protein